MILQNENNDKTDRYEHLVEWRSERPDFSDREFEEAMADIEDYLRLAWRTYREMHKDEPLPDEL